MNNLTEAIAHQIIIDAGGNLTLAAGSLGMLRGELVAIIKQWPRVEMRVANIREGMVDLAESLLQEAVDAKKPWAVTFTLKTLGKTRGHGRPKAQRKARKHAQTGETDPARMNAEQLANFQRMQGIATGNGHDIAEPEFVKQLDEAGAGVVVAGCGGDLNGAARKLGVTRDQLADYLTRRPLLHGAASDTREEVIDHAESALRSALAAKKAWAIRFTLKTLGAPLGYFEYTEPAPTAPLLPPVIIDLSKLKDEELTRFERLSEIQGGLPGGAIITRYIARPAATTPDAGPPGGGPVATAPVAAAAPAPENDRVTEPAKVPVAARPTRSLPVRMIGIASRWIGVGVV